MWTVIHPLLVLWLLSAGWAHHAHATTLYVKAGAPDGGNGTTWAMAFNSLDSALAAASAAGGSNQIWVAKGTYKPVTPYIGACGAACSSSTANLVTFKIPSNTSIYGGFAGTETLLSQRNVSANSTVLSGDINNDDITVSSNTPSSKLDNAWHVITADGATGVLLDGLVVQGGYAAGPDAGTQDEHFRIASITYDHGTGGGLFAINGAQVKVNNSRFQNNVAAANSGSTLTGTPGIGSPPVAVGGGAIGSIGSAISISNSTFNGNSAINMGANGGALNSLLGGSYTISNSTFTNNTADRTGGAIQANDSNDGVSVTSSTFQNNRTTGVVTLDESGGAIGTINTVLKVSNSTFTGNSAPAAGGGAIFFHIPFDDEEAYTLVVQNSTFTGNITSAIGGGAINIFGILPNAGSYANITNCAFRNNSGGFGGAVYADSIPTLVNNSSFSGNTAWVEGGAVFVANFSDSVFASAGTSFSIMNSSFQQNSLSGVPESFANSYIASIGFNTPTLVFNLVAFGFGPHDIPDALNPIFAGVSAMNAGGGAVASEFGSSLLISNSSFSNNNALNGYGGAVVSGGVHGNSAGGATELMDSSTVIISNSSCKGNSATLGGNNSIAYPGTLATLVANSKCQ